jgi:hypothetical protein
LGGGTWNFGLRPSVFGLRSSVFCLRSSSLGIRLRSSVLCLRSSVFELRSPFLPTLSFMTDCVFKRRPILQKRPYTRPYKNSECYCDNDLICSDQVICDLIHVQHNTEYPTKLPASCNWADAWPPYVGSLSGQGMAPHQCGHQLPSPLPLVWYRLVALRATGADHCIGRSPQKPQPRTSTPVYQCCPARCLSTEAPHPR